jgi:hypothetical protein
MAIEVGNKRAFLKRLCEKDDLLHKILFILEVKSFLSHRTKLIAGVTRKYYSTNN